MEEKKAQEDALMNAQTEFNSMQEELEASRKLIKTLKGKYEQALCEIKDLSQEQTDEKEDLMVQLRQQDLDIKFYRRVVEMVMKPEELTKIKHKSSYDDGSGDWNIPVFLLKAREVALPSLSIKK